MMYKTINFLTRLPNKYLMIFLFIIIFFAYLWLQTDFLGNLAEKALIAVLALLGTSSKAFYDDNKGKYVDRRNNEYKNS